MNQSEKHGTGKCFECPNHTIDCPRNRCVEYKVLEEKRRIAKETWDAEKHHPAREYLLDYHKRRESNELRKGKRKRIK